MARTFNGSSSYLERTPSPLTGLPITLACWFNAPNITANHTLMSISSGSGTARRRHITAAGAQTGDRIRATDGTSVAQSSVGYSANTWHHAAGIFSGDASRDAFLDGGNKQSNSGSAATVADNVDALRIGALTVTGTNVWNGGMVADAAVWSVALTDDEIAELASGVSAKFIRPDAIVAYWPLFSADGDVDHWGQNDLTAVSSPTYGDHPPIIYPSGIKYFLPVSGGPPPSSGAPVPYLTNFLIQPAGQT